MTKNLQPIESQFLIYSSPNGDIKVEALFQEETIWLSLNKIADLFGTSKQNISYHLQNIYQENELPKDSTVKEILTVQKEGNRNVQRSLDYYNIDATISVGYRVNSYEATQFRIWATKTLKEYLIKGFVMDDERLKNGSHLGKDFYDELLERIREIRASERRFYQKITDIYAQCSIDYDSKAPITQEFYATVQNKLHWTITGKTASELISDRADASKPHLGMKTWKNAPRGKILKSDVSIAKNYLDEDELKKLNRIVTMYLDYAENRAERQIPMKMADWAKKLDLFLEFNDYQILKNAGKVQAKIAKTLAENEYSKFRIVQDQRFQSDFDLTANKILENEASKY